MRHGNFGKVVLFLIIFSAILGCYAQDEHKNPAPLLPIIKAMKYGYIDRQGRIVIKPQFDYAWDFSEGMGRFSKNEKQGFVNSSGKIIIKPQFVAANNFSDGLALVTIPDGACILCGEAAYIDKTGKFIVNAKHIGESLARNRRFKDFSEGLAGFYIEDKTKTINEVLPYGFINKIGKISIERKFGDIGEFREGLATFARDFLRTSGYGYINQRGEIVIEPKFDSANEFKEGLASVRLKDKYGFIDKTGAFVVEPKFDDAWPFSEGYALIRINGKYGYINKTGKIVIEPQFEWSWHFSEGLAPAKLNSKIGYINQKGIFVIPPKFEEVDYNGFSGGIAKVFEIYKLNYPYKIGYINKNGEYIWKPTI